MEPTCWICRRRLAGGRIRFVTLIPSRAVPRPVHRCCAERDGLVAADVRRLDAKWKGVTNGTKNGTKPRH